MLSTKILLTSILSFIVSWIIVDFCEDSNYENAKLIAMCIGLSSIVAFIISLFMKIWGY